jgi:hypothetical protein
LVRRAAVERQEDYHDLGGIAETEPQIASDCIHRFRRLPGLR